MPTKKLKVANQCCDSDTDSHNVNDNAQQNKRQCGRKCTIKPGLFITARETPLKVLSIL